MKLSEIVWSDTERPVWNNIKGNNFSWLRTAMLDKESETASGHRAGKTTHVAWWPDENIYAYNGVRMGPLEFAAVIREYFCQVRYNEYGTF